MSNTCDIWHTLSWKEAYTALPGAGGAGSRARRGQSAWSLLPPGHQLCHLHQPCRACPGFAQKLLPPSAQTHLFWFSEASCGVQQITSGLWVPSWLSEIILIKNHLHTGKLDVLWPWLAVSRSGLLSLEVQPVLGSVGLSQDWRQISAPVGSSWTISRLRQVIGRLNETCSDNVVDLKFYQPAK